MTYACVEEGNTAQLVHCFNWDAFFDINFAIDFALISWDKVGRYTETRGIKSILDSKPTKKV
jgi:hypothetical protein